MFGEPGVRLYESITKEFELGEHELALLTEACHVADVCGELQALVDEGGPMVFVRGEPRPNPALVELRAQRLLLARLIVALRVPLGEAEAPASRTQRRGLRGVYGNVARIG